MNTKNNIKAVFLDLYGTVFIENQWLPGAKETVDWLLKNELQIRFITNTTLKNRKMLSEIFSHIGIQVPSESFFIPARAARNWFIENPPKTGILPLVHSSQIEDLGDIPLVYNESADFVLVGDMGDEWNIDIMNKGLRTLAAGAALTALQQNPYWLAADGIRLDTGSFVAALEYGAGIKCQYVFGKPNELFFKMALADTGITPEHTIMVGDDYQSDIIGASRCGIKGVLLKSGKYDYTKFPEKAFAVINGIGALPSWIENQ
ncbi:MAG: HAD hydrolase-like protein [candidate division Zixibacteria bacterium]|nr:HAD hydrolase-like protein [candidate division Zixibacteria bacterium]